MEIPDEIQSFLQEHHVLTLSTVADDQPYSCACFYVFRFPYFVFASHPETRHAREMRRNSKVAIAVHSMVRTVADIKGVQATGRCVDISEQPYPPVALVELREHYLEEFPEANEIPASFWGVTVDFIKMTDNSVRFGHKIIWQDQPE